MRENSIFFLVNIFCQELKGQRKSCEGSEILPNFHINKLPALVSQMLAEDMRHLGQR